MGYRNCKHVGKIVMDDGSIADIYMNEKERRKLDFAVEKFRMAQEKENGHTPDWTAADELMHAIYEYLIKLPDPEEMETPAVGAAGEPKGFSNELIAPL